MTAPEPPEGVLIARARAGDPEAFGVLVTRHERLAFRTAYVLCGDSAEAQDATQEGFLKAYVALPRFRPGAPFRPWLLRIVGNEARNRARSAGRRAQLVTRVAGQDGAGRSAAGADVAVLAGVRRAALAAALSRLAPDHREILVLRYLLDLSEQDCAAALDCRPGTVKSRHARAMARLRAELGEEETADA